MLKDLTKLCKKTGINGRIITAFADCVIGDQPWIDIMENLPSDLVVEEPVAVVETESALVDDLTPVGLSLVIETPPVVPTGTVLGGTGARFVGVLDVLKKYFINETEYLIDDNQLLVTLDTYKAYCTIVNDESSRVIRSQLLQMEANHRNLLLTDDDSNSSEGSSESGSGDSESGSESDSDCDSDCEDHVSDDDCDTDDCDTDDGSDDLDMAVYGCNKSKTDAACYTLMNLFRSVKSVHESRIHDNVKQIFIDKFLGLVTGVDITSDY